MSRGTVISAVNNEQVLRDNLLRSRPIAGGDLDVIIERGHSTAGAAYNAGLARTQSDCVIFAHQDVYFPADWLEWLHAAIGYLEEKGEPWAVLGVWGVTSGRQWVGRVWCSGGEKEHCGTVERLPAEVASIDEIVIVLNRKARLRFDASLPGFHLYATDIILQAREQGYKSFVFDGPVVHNSRRNPQPLDCAYRSAYRYMQRKWGRRLPVQTCVVDVTWGGLPMYKQIVRKELRRLTGKVKAAPPAPDPAAIAHRLGYEAVTEPAQ